MKVTSIVFLFIIFFFPLASLYSEDEEVSNVLNSTLQTLPILNQDDTIKETIETTDSYVEDQIFAHEMIYKLKYRMDYRMGKKNQSVYYYIPELNISYQFDGGANSDVKTIEEASYISEFDDICKENTNTEFFYYVAPGKRNSIPDEYVKYDYNQNTNKYRQTLIRDILSDYECITTKYDENLLKLTDYYNYNHHYNSTGIYKVYKDFLNSYNDIYGTSYTPLEEKDLKSVPVSSVYALNNLFNDTVENFTEEKAPINVESESTNPYNAISEDRVGFYQNPNPSDDAEDILFVTDSFGQGLLPYIVTNFNTINSVNFYDYAADPTLLEKELDENEYDRVVIYSYDFNVLDR